MKKTLASKKKILGFTLIELLAVVTIMSILFAIGLVTYTNAARNARNSRRRTDITNLRQALVLYRSDLNCYPNNLVDLTPNYWSETNIPTDPSGASHPQYSYIPDLPVGGCIPGFTLSATLEPIAVPPELFTVTNP